MPRPPRRKMGYIRRRQIRREYIRRKRLELKQASTSQNEESLRKRLNQQALSNLLLSEEQGIEREKISKSNSFENDYQMSMPLDIQIKVEPCEEEIAQIKVEPCDEEAVQIKVEPCDEESEQMSYSQTDSSVTSSSCKDFNNGGKNYLQMGLVFNSTTAEGECDAAEFVEACYAEKNEDELIVPDIASDSESDDNSNGFLREHSASTSLGTMQIKVEPSEEESGDYVCSCPVDASSMLSSYNVSQNQYTTYEILFEAVKYLDDRGNEDKFEAAEKYYIYRLRSASQIQQRFARRIIDQVLVEAEKGNLNRLVGLFHCQDRKILIDSPVESNNNKLATNLRLLDLHYVCPLKNKVLNKMKESLVKCVKQNPSSKPYASRLRSLSTVQYLLADKLINDILSEAVLGKLRRFSKICFPLEDPTKKRISCNKSLKSMQQSVSKKSETTPRLTQNSSKASFREEDPLLMQQPSIIPTPNQILEQNSVVTSALQNQKESCSNTQTSKQNSNILLNTEDSSIPIEKEYFDPTST